MKVFNGLDLQNQKAVNVADPSNGTDAANKQYVDNVARGLQWKQPTRVASTTNITLSSPGATIDGITMVSGDRVLLKNQTTSSENGIWVWTGSAAALTRALDADNTGELGPGTCVYITEGSVNADKSFVIISDTAITIGTTSIVWGQFGGGQTYSAGNGLSLEGSTFTVVAAPSGGLTVGASGIGVDTTVIARKYSASVGNGSLTSIPVTHNLNTQDVHVSIRETATNAGALVDWIATDVNTVTLSFATAPAANAIRVTIIG